MAVVEIRMGLETNEGTESFLGLWHKKPGDAVKANEPIAEISTDKVALEVSAPADGVLMEILKPEGERIVPGDLLARLETAAPATQPREPESTPDERGSPPAARPAPADLDALSPAVRRLLAKHGLDATSIPATGRGGRLTHRDVESFLETQKEAPKRETGSRFVPHTAMRRAIAAHMTKSLQSAPHVTALFEADFSRVLADRAAKKQSASSPEEVPTLTAYLIHASVQAIRAVPEANSRWYEDKLEIFKDINIGFGTATPDGGLIVPVIHRAQELDVPQIGNRLRLLTAKAREGKLAHDEVENGTFTLSNHGVGGSLMAAPVIIYQAQAAILGAGKLQMRPVVNPETDAVEVKPMMYVTLTVDHRILDGQQTGKFIRHFVETLETQN